MAFTSYNYVLVATAILVSYFFISKLVRSIQRYRFATSKGCEPVPVYPQRETILGYDYFKALSTSAKNKTFFLDSTKIFDQLGDTYYVKSFGKQVFHTRDPENFKWTLSTDFKNFKNGWRSKPFGRLLGRGLVLIDGAEWEHSRARLRPSFSRSQVADLSTFETHIQELIKKVPRDGSTVDLMPLFFHLTLDSATEFLLGESVDIMNNPKGSPQEAFATAFDSALSSLIVRLRLGKLLFLYRSPTFEKNCNIVHAFVDKFISKALEARESEKGVEEANEKDGKYVFLNELLKQTQNPVELRDEILTVLLGGRDTTAGLLSHVFRELMHQPAVLQKLKDEIAYLQGGKPDYEELKNMKYLKYVLQETLRLYPPVPSITRLAAHDTILPHGGGPRGTSPIFVPANSFVSLNIFALCRSPSVYPNPDSFIPERWENTRLGWSWPVFAGGPRICPGQQFALLEAGYTTVRLLQTWAMEGNGEVVMEGRDDGGWREGLTVTLFSGRGTKVALVPRREA